MIRFITDRLKHTEKSEIVQNKAALLLLCCLLVCRGQIKDSLSPLSLGVLTFYSG